MNWFTRGTPSDPAEPARDSETAAPPAIATWRVLAAIVLCLANAALSGVLLLQHHGQAAGLAAVNQLCGPAADSGCAEVARSRWSEVGGVPLAAVGLAFFAAVALLLLLGTMAGREARTAAAAVALLALVLAVAVDVVLLGIQAVAIRAFCRLCLLTYGLNALAVVALLPTRRDGSVVGEAVSRRDGRLAFGAWAVAALAVVLGVAMTEWALSRAQAAGAAGILGAPPPVAAGGEADSYREQARAASEQARQLQEILDDPEKLERYFADKAAREFDQAPVHALDLAGVAFKGPPQAPVKVVEYSDFLCPFCRDVAAGFSNYLPRSGGRVAIYYKNFPLDSECNPAVKRAVHPGACLLALGGLCAQDQGRFWPYHDRVFGAPSSNPQTHDVLRLGIEAGVEAGAFEKCLTSGAARDRLKAEIEEAQRVGVNSTPTLYVNGRRLPRVNDFMMTVDKEAARLGVAPPAR